MQIENSANQVSMQGPLNGMYIVITGKFEQPREHIADRLRQLGAEIQSAVTKKTNICVVGSDAGSKAKKADQLGITRWDADKLRDFIQEK